MYPHLDTVQKCCIFCYFCQLFHQCSIRHHIVWYSLHHRKLPEDEAQTKPVVKESKVHVLIYLMKKVVEYVIKNYTNKSK